jgi:hypothetical protein
MGGAASALAFLRGEFAARGWHAQGNSRYMGGHHGVWNRGKEHAIEMPVMMERRNEDFSL